MNIQKDTFHSIIQSSSYGLLRGIFVHSLIYPLETLKIRKQCLSDTTSYQIALEILQKNGLSGFYQGLSSQLLKTSLKQIGVWPILINLPIYLEKYPLYEFQKQAITGVFIATFDAFITTALEKRKILAIIKEKNHFSKHSYRDGWKGLSTNWTKLSVNWSTFLVTQKILRDVYQKKQDEPLTFFQLMQIGVEVACIVSFVSSPFDVANTLKLAKNIKFFELFSGNIPRNLTKGLSLNTLSLIIHNVASVIVIEKLSKKQTF